MNDKEYNSIKFGMIFSYLQQYTDVPNDIFTTDAQHVAVLIKEETGR